MRIYTQGFEGSNLASDGLTSTGAITYDSNPIRRDLFSDGSVWCARTDNDSTAFYATNAKSFQEMNDIGVEPKEFWLKFGFYLESTFRTKIRFQNSSATTFSGVITSLTSNIIYSDDFSTAENTTFDAPAPGRWDIYEMHVYLDASSGFIRIYRSGLSELVNEWSGDTTNSVSGGLAYITFAGGRYIDDIAINTPTMLYDTGTGGTPGVGNVVTGGTSGATATIDGYDGDATSGRLFLSGVSGSFTDGETMTDTGTFSADVNAPTSAFIGGLEPNSGRPGDGYVIRFAPNGDSSAGLTGSDGNSTDNYLLVDNFAISLTTDYVEDTTGGNEDKYTFETFSNRSVGVIGSVNAVTVKSNAQREGVTVNNIQLSVTSGSTTEYSSDRSLATSYEVHTKHYGYNPDTNANWTETNIDDLIAGHKFTV